MSQRADSDFVFRIRSNAFDQRGATMLEFALISIVFFLLLGAIFDLGLGLHRRSYLQHVAEKSAREGGIILTTTRNCPAVRNYLDTVATPELASAFAAGAQVRWAYAVVDGRPFDSLVVQGTIPFDCFFICHLLPGGSTITRSGRATVETTLAGPCNG